ncbi:MAG: pyridoxine 5'-phosphate synthase [Epsilonproteobacteria bacterium]|nr:pyridoxine 5'-phosphate synthase [Campylobacterota bacterium]PIP10621.1 MAG: pyridoxine 5'-phosphate synthase [Sulfurimonas sp. CG23_combo_of_CG06-09_8_20_14_all_36_33]PIS25594.1 MAG: pyridoxine 5'-phosphate synthase [Sulfurimonas sp. CG08_land_8_20_14_0_20_36_33]PIU34901.1 MAG: pyridoxine 5'-phosphate synthase [Sulfurimonas sp. CG07_land_8_20_14_0_80_36_56]PIV04614.1 MAG: pyridoxine 5'-phosphate synthase [Sulfurimonas sp. CG03_land_8_20_14_0_80_36_25]PIV36447.1 MAG: pyridoxine 5'-phosphate
MSRMRLGVNIDHVAVLREARKVNDPDILQALYVACSNGADQITIHLREDRRHIQDADAQNIMKLSPLPINLECSINREILDIVCELKPHRATLVPEKREEVTTEGGLDVFTFEDEIAYAVEQLHDSLIPVSLFVDPNIEVMNKSKELGAEMVELHTGTFANLFAMLHSSLPYSNHSVKEYALPRYELSERLEKAIEDIKNAAIHANKIGLEVAAGHGLNYHNVHEMMKIQEIIELNIGQSIIARSVFTGLADAVKEMKRLTTR